MKTMKHLIAAVMGCGLLGLAEQAEAGRKKKVVDQVTEAVEGENGPDVTGAEIPALAAVLAKTGWEPTPAMDGKFMVGGIYDGNHDVQLTGCIGAAPTAAAVAEIEADIRAGVQGRFRSGVAGAEVELDIVRRMWLGTPTNLYIPALDVALTQQCTQKLQVAQRAGTDLSDWYLIYKVLQSTIENNECGKVEGGVFLKLTDAELKAYGIQSCAIKSTEPVPIGFGTRDITELLGAPPAASAPGSPAVSVVTSGAFRGTLDVSTALAEQACEAAAQGLVETQRAERIEAEVATLEGESEKAWASLSESAIACLKLDGLEARAPCIDRVQEFVNWSKELQVVLSEGFEEVETDCGMRAVPVLESRRALSVPETALADALRRQLAGGSALVQLSAGMSHTCGVTAAGAVTCWGNKEDGRADPPQISFQTVDASYRQSCGVTTAGAVECWGLDDHGQASPPSGTFTSVSVAGDHACGLTTTGTVKCWGEEEDGRTDPPQISFQSVSNGYRYSCGVTTDGAVECWGLDAHGQASPPTGTFTSVSTGGSHSCGVTTTGSVKCWGKNDFGQSSPPPDTFSTVSVGSEHTCGLTTTGTVRCWGSNKYFFDDAGQARPPGGIFSLVSAGSRHTCGVMATGPVRCWGLNHDGQASPPEEWRVLPIVAASEASASPPRDQGWYRLTPRTRLDALLSECKAGRATSCGGAGILVHQGGEGLGRAQPDQAHDLYDQACASGVARDCITLGHHYQFGGPAYEKESCERNDEKAVELYERACADGHGDLLGCSWLGSMYERGRGVSQDLSRAKELYGYTLRPLWAGCEAGDTESCSELINIYDGYATSIPLKILGLSRVGIPLSDPRRDHARLRIQEAYWSRCEDGDAEACHQLSRTKMDQLLSSVTGGAQPHEMAARACHLGNVNGCLRSYNRAKKESTYYRFGHTFYWVKNQILERYYRKRTCTSDTSTHSVEYYYSITYSEACPSEATR